MAPHAEVADGTMNGFGANGIATPPEYVDNQQDLFVVNSPNVQYSNSTIKSKYTYHTTTVSKSGNGYVATPKETSYDFQVDRQVGKTGLMLVGLGGNNGTTVTAGILANKRALTFETKEGPRKSNYYGSLVMSSTMKLGTEALTGEEINIPFRDVLPMVHPNDLVIGGWDISSMNLADAMDRAQVLEPDLKRQVRKEMAQMTPLKSIYYPDFIAANQEDRADHVLEGSKACMAHVEHLRKDIR
jgi:myo-inositol-1-phosphate synthase